MNEYKSIGDLPDVLTAPMIASFIGVSVRQAYVLMNTSLEAGGIPTKTIGAKNKRVLKAKLINWLEQN